MIKRNQLIHILRLKITNSNKIFFAPWNKESHKLSSYRNILKNVAKEKDNRHAENRSNTNAKNDREEKLKQAKK